MSEPIDEEMYLNNYYYFQESLVVLSRDAEAQCQVMGYSNVPWHIKDETVSNDEAVLSTMSTQLSEQQKAQIRQLLENVANIPEVVINVPNSKEAQLHAMSDAYWVPLRAQAKQLISILGAETDRVSAALGMNRS